jgi:hypothetical protein
VNRRIFRRVADDLKQAAFIAHVDENDPAVVAVVFGPARDGDALADLLFA